VFLKTQAFMNCKILIVILLFLGLMACNSPGKNQNRGGGDDRADSLGMKVDKTDLRSVVPSPSQTVLLLHNCPVAFDVSVLTPIRDLKKYNTSFDKALLLGFYGADLCYLGLTEQKELISKYVKEITQLMSELEIDFQEQDKILLAIEQNIGDTNLILKSFNKIFTQSDAYLIKNERTDVCALIVAGGWIESFYILNELHRKNPGTFCLVELIQYQSYILDHLIATLAPYYNSTQYGPLIDRLVEIAYEFDLMDIHTGDISCKTDSIKKFTYVQNPVLFDYTGSKPDSLSVYISQLKSYYVQ
jgi:hypothetical protein